MWASGVRTQRNFRDTGALRATVNTRQRLNKHSTGRPWRSLHVQGASRLLYSAGPRAVTKARHPLGETSKDRSHDTRMWSCQLSTVLGAKGTGL